MKLRALFAVVLLVAPLSVALAGVRIVEPADGATVGTEVKVVMSVDGMGIKPAGDTTPNTGHLHLIINGGPVPAGVLIPADAQHLHYGKGQTEAILNLAPGHHTLTLQFADGAHKSYGPEWAQTITLDVK